jgi:hypothetical protein
MVNGLGIRVKVNRAFTVAGTLTLAGEAPLPLAGSHLLRCEVPRFERGGDRITLVHAPNPLLTEPITLVK